MVGILHPLNHVTFWSRDHVTNVKLVIYTSAIPIATKLARVIICGGGAPTSMLRDLLITWSRGKWKKLISALPQYLWPPNWQSDNLPWWTPPTNSPDHLIMWSPYKWKAFYLHFRNTYGHQTWQSGNLLWGTPTSKSRGLFTT